MNRKMNRATFAVLASLFVLARTAFAADEPEMTEFALATEGHRPQAITAGPDGNLWATEVIKHIILRITPTGEITEFPVPGTGVGVLQGIAPGADNTIWFTSREENMVRRMTTDGKFTGEFKIPSTSTVPGDMTKGCWPREIAPGPDGNLWFAEMSTSKIGRITPQGEIKEFPIPTELSKPYCVVTGPDKNIWFTESAVNKIGKLEPDTGKVTEFAIPTAKAFAREITVGADGNLWFTENSADKIGKITPDGKITEFDLPKASQPVGITKGSDGNVWFCEFKSGKIGRITPEGKITEFAVKAPNGQPFCITSGPDGNVWYALQANRIGRIKLK